MAGKLIDVIATKYDATPLQPVEVPEWGVTLYFRPLTPAERASIRKGISENDDEEMLVAGLIRKALDADGKPVFDDNAETRAALHTKGDLNVIVRIMADVGKSAASKAKNG